jgi:hypothetical protein
VEHKTVTAFPHLVVREATVGFLVLAGLALFALTVPLEMLPPASDEFADAARKAPWFLVGVQEMLYHLPPKWTAAFLPALAVLFLLAMPYLSWKRVALGELRHSAGKWAWFVLWLVLAAAFHFGAVMPFHAQTALTLLFLGLSVWGVFAPRRSPAGLSLTEVFFLYLVASYGVWTITGLWLRTDDWQPLVPFIG